MRLEDAAVRPGSVADADAVATVLAAAFADDPQFRWVLGSLDSPAPRLQRLFRLQVRREILPAGLVDVALVNGLVAGAALWNRPGQWRPPLLVQLRNLPGYLRVFGRRLWAAQRALRAIELAHPDEPHWHLAGIGVHPDLQGTGVGAALLRHRLALVDDDRLPAYLESSKPRNVAWYEHFGFEVRYQVTLPAGCPATTTMWRPPQTPAG